MQTNPLVGVIMMEVRNGPPANAPDAELLCSWALRWKCVGGGLGIFRYGTPNNGTPLPISFPYHSHTSRCSYGSSMGMGVPRISLEGVLG